MVEVSRDVVVGQLGLAPLVDPRRPSLGLGYRRRRRVSHVAGGGDGEVDDMVVMAERRGLLDVANIGGVVEWRCLAWTRSSLYEGGQIIRRSSPPTGVVSVGRAARRAAGCAGLDDAIGLSVGWVTWKWLVRRTGCTSSTPSSTSGRY
jgi:hypothetical protein